MKQETVHQRVDLLRQRGMTIAEIANAAGLGLGTVAEIATRLTGDPRSSTVRAIMSVRVPRRKKSQNEGAV